MSRLIYFHEISSYSMLDIVMKVVCTRVGNYWCKVGLETS